MVSIIKVFAVFAYGAFCGYVVRKNDLDTKFLHAVNEAWETRIRKDAQIIRTEMTNGSYQRSVQLPNAQRDEPLLPDENLTTPEHELHARS